ncbi:MAG: hypothetical protein IT177_12345 [Acidobacteria bacterium]|nr:hypothetical protein [Acidobacteriota bacterium]
MMQRDDEFYIGYEAAMPPGMRRVVRTWVACASLLALVIVAVVTLASHPLAVSRFVYGETRAWTGYLVRLPAPSLLVPGERGFRRYWLVSRGKQGADRVLRGLADGWVTVRGSEIARDPWRMVEVAEAASSRGAAARPAPPAAEPGPGRRVSLRGEIVDSKCFLGVMNPGERTVHRDCAIRCLSGGVTPMLAFTDEGGEHQLAVIVDAAGIVPFPAIRNRVGRPVEVSGQLFTVDDLLVLRLDSTTGA